MTLSYYNLNRYCWKSGLSRPLLVRFETNITRNSFWSIPVNGWKEGTENVCILQCSQNFPNMVYISCWNSTGYLPLIGQKQPEKIWDKTFTNDGQNAIAGIKSYISMHFDITTGGNTLIDVIKYLELLPLCSRITFKERIVSDENGGLY